MDEAADWSTDSSIIQPYVILLTEFTVQGPCLIS